MIDEKQCTVLLALHNDVVVLPNKEPHLADSEVQSWEWERWNGEKCGNGI